MQLLVGHCLFWTLQAFLEKPPMHPLANDYYTCVTVDDHDQFHIHLIVALSVIFPDIQHFWCIHQEPCCHPDVWNCWCIKYTNKLSIMSLYIFRVRLVLIWSTILSFFWVYISKFWQLVLVVSFFFHSVVKTEGEILIFKYFGNLLKLFK